MRGEKTIMDNINDTKDTENKNKEKELQEIFEEQLKWEQQRSTVNTQYADLMRNRQLVMMRYKKLKKGIRRAITLCIIVLCIVVAESIWMFFSRYNFIEAKSDRMRQEYEAEYIQWKAGEIKSYYGKYVEKNRNTRQIAATGLNEGSRDEINSYIASLDRVEKGLSTENIGPITCLTDTQTYDFSNYTIAGNNTVIFPGAVVKGDSLFQGTADYTLLSMDRTPVYLTSDQAGGNSAEIKDVSYRGTVEFINNCAEKNEGEVAKEWTYYMHVFNSSKELTASLGIELPIVGGLDFGSTSKTEVSNVAVVYRQIYYTVGVEPKKSAADYFQGDLDMAATGDYEPAYISSVDYGRMVIVLIQGEMSSSELSAKVSACIKGVGISAGLANICMDSQIDSRIFQYGGEQKDAGMITDTTQKTQGIVDRWNEFWYGSDDKETVENRINDFICTDAPATNPVPVGYTLKYLSDNSFVPAMMVTGQETMLAEQGDIKRVKITTDVPVVWDKTGGTDYMSMSLPVSLASYYQYEFLWNSGGSGMLQGTILLWEEWEEELQRVEVQLNLADCLPYGGKNVAIGGVNSEKPVGYGILSHYEVHTEPIEVDVVISDY